MEQILVLAALLALCCLLLHAEGLTSRESGGGSGVFLLLLGAFAVRYYLLDRCPCAGEDAVRDAISYFRDAGGLWGLRSFHGAFSVPVQYCLAFCSYARTGSLYIFKYLCFFGDIVLAWGCQRCVAAVSLRETPRRWAFFLVLFFPALLLLSCAGTGDGLRWIFPVLAVSAALQGKFRLIGAMLGLAIAADPGMIWLLPVFWVFPALRQNTGRSIPWLLGTFFLALLPALLLGRPTALTLPFWPRIDPPAGRIELARIPFFTLSPVAGIGIWAGLTALTIYRLCGRDAIHDRRRQLAGLELAALAAGGLLPDGAGFLTGGAVLALTLCCLGRGMIPAALCAAFAASLSVFSTVFPKLLPIPLWWGSAALLAGIVILLGYVLFKRS